MIGGYSSSWYGGHSHLTTGDDPTRVIARTALPIMTPDGAHRDGYVPNVVYSCGGFAHGDLLVLPYGIGDRSISVATIGISALIASMQRVS